MILFKHLFFKYFKLPGFKRKSEGVLYVCTLMLIQFQFLSAQKNEEVSNEHFGIISLKTNVTIYSKDKDFNQQITDGKVLINKRLFSVNHEKYYLRKKQVGNENLHIENDCSEKLYLESEASNSLESTLISFKNPGARQVGNEINDQGIDIEELNSETLNDQSRLISLKNGAKIFSSDEQFNKQINSKKTRITSAIISEVNSGDRIYLIITSNTGVPKKFYNASVQVGNHKIKVASSLLKEENLTPREKENGTFIGDCLQEYPSSSGFSNTQRRNTDYISSRTDRKDYSKASTFKNCYILTRALNYLYSQDFIHNNSKSSDFCFSKCFSIRPPPFLSII